MTMTRKLENQIEPVTSPFTQVRNDRELEDVAEHHPFLRTVHDKVLLLVKTSDWSPQGTNYFFAYSEQSDFKVIKVKEEDMGYDGKGRISISGLNHVTTLSERAPKHPGLPLDYFAILGRFGGIGR